ncbi:MAG: hypothetical protein U1A27_00220 [Phycisphaerae bacterium]
MSRAVTSRLARPGRTRLTPLPENECWLLGLVNAIDGCCVPAGGKLERIGRRLERRGLMRISGAGEELVLSLTRAGLEYIA